MSGFFGQIAGGLLGNTIAVQALPGLLTQILGTAEGASGGGLSALVAQLEAGGLGAHVRSWISGEPNLPVAPEQLGQALPPAQVQSWADQTGTTPEALLGALAQALPHAIDHATPNGEMPAPGTPVPDYATLLGRLFRG